MNLRELKNELLSHSTKEDIHPNYRTENKKLKIYMQKQGKNVKQNLQS